MDSLENRFSIGHSLEHSAQGTPVPPPPVEPVPAPEPYPLAIAGSRARVAVDQDGQLAPLTEPAPARRVQAALPSYLRLTGFGELAPDRERGDDEAAAHLRRVRPAAFALPGMYPARAQAAQHAAGVWQTGIRRASAVLGAPTSGAPGSPPQAPRAARPPLPACWATTSAVDADDTGTELRSARDDLVVVRADHPVPDACAVFYFEVTIKESAADRMVALGLCDGACALAKLPGLEAKSYAYHGDDGRIVVSQGAARLYGPRFGAGDVVGCGYDRERRAIFFTKNGLSLEAAFADVGERLFPTLGFRGAHVVATNFGAREFAYDIERYVRERKQAVAERVRACGVRPVAVADAFDGAFAEELVATYLRHCGLVESARAYDAERAMSHPERAVSRPEDAKSDNAKSAAEHAMSGVELAKSDDADAKSGDELARRQQVRALVLEGRIADALALLERFFPAVLEDERIVFELKCRRFVELVRRAAPHPERLGEVVACGRQLQAEYRADRRPGVQERLEHIFALLAYEDPAADPAAAELLSPSHLTKLAEELNAAMLVAQGLPAVAPLQRIAQHVTQIAYELADLGDAAACLLNVRRDFL